METSSIDRGMTTTTSIDSAALSPCVVCESRVDWDRPEGSLSNRTRATSLCPPQDDPNPKDLPIHGRIRGNIPLLALEQRITVLGKRKEQPSAQFPHTRLLPAYQSNAAIDEQVLRLALSLACQNKKRKKQVHEIPN